MNKVLLLMTLLAFSLFACNDVSDFLFETDQDVIVRSVDNGGLFAGGESFDIHIHSESAVLPEKYTVTIFDIESTNWGETTIEIEEPGEDYNSNLVVPEELPPGKYFFLITVYESDLVVASHEVALFKIDEEYSVDQMVTLPHETAAGKDVYIFADLTYPEGVNPYLRWIVKGEIFKEGFLIDIENQKIVNYLQWTADEETGLHKIELQIFPEECDQSYISTVNNYVEVIVTESKPREPNALVPEESYSLLYHFDGDLHPVQSEKFVSTSYGEMGAIPSNNSFFYTLSGNSGISSEGAILPVDAGAVTPFSINARMSPVFPYESGNVLSLFDGESQLMTISMDDAGLLELTVGEEESLSLFTLYDMSDFTIHIIPLFDSLEIRWFVDGMFIGQENLATPLPAILWESQKLLIGGDEDTYSAPVALDEFGIFVGDEENSAVDAQQFKRVKAYELGENLIDADGFDGLDPGLNIASGEKTLISSFKGSLKDLETVLSFEDIIDEENWDLILEDEEGEEMFRISNTQFFLTNEDDEVINKDIRFVLSGQEEIATLSLNENVALFPEDFSYNPGQEYSLFLETHVENINDVILDYYIIYSITDSLIPTTVVMAEEESPL